MMCDGFGNAFGSNRNDVAGAERKFFSGGLGLHDGTVDVIARFESGQEIAYTGILDKDAMDSVAGSKFQGRVQVAKAGANAASFKPVNTGGTVGGPVVVHAIAAINISIEGSSQWDGDVRHPGWTMAFAVDKTGNEASFEITCMGESHVFVCETVAEKDAWLSSVGACIARASRSFAH